MHKLTLIITLVTTLVVFSLLSLFELWVLKLLGFDFFAHLSAVYERGDGVQFTFEVFGALAFVIAQPLALLYGLVRAIDKLAPAKFDQTVKPMAEILAQKLFHL